MPNGVELSWRGRLPTVLPVKKENNKKASQVRPKISWNLISVYLVRDF